MEFCAETFHRDFPTVRRLFYGVEDFLWCADFSMVWRLFYGA